MLEHVVKMMKQGTVIKVIVRRAKGKGALKRKNQTVEGTRVSRALPKLLSLDDFGNLGRKGQREETRSLLQKEPGNVLCTYLTCRQHHSWT